MKCRAQGWQRATYRKCISKALNLLYYGLYCAVLFRQILYQNIVYALRSIALKTYLYVEMQLCMAGRFGLLVGWYMNRTVNMGPYLWENVGLANLMIQ